MLHLGVCAGSGALVVAADGVRLASPRMPDYPDATLRFLAAAEAAGLQAEPVVFPAGTKTSADAARAVNCDLSQIAKSIVFMAGDEPVVVFMSGDRRVDVDRLGTLVGAPARRATLDEARRHTGFAAGGTPPLGYPKPVRVFADVSLQRNTDVWSAAGTPTTVFPVALETLVATAGAEWVDVAEGADGG